MAAIVKKKAFLMKLISGDIELYNGKGKIIEPVKATLVTGAC